jgi:hypothetical protein
MIQLPLTPANLPVDSPGTATNSATHRARTTRPAGVTPRMVSSKLPGSLAPWSVRPYQVTSRSLSAPMKTNGVVPLPNSPVMTPWSKSGTAESVRTLPSP